MLYALLFPTVSSASYIVLSYSTSFDHADNICSNAQIMNLFVIRMFLYHCYLISLGNDDDNDGSTALIGETNVSSSVAITRHKMWGRYCANKLQEKLIIKPNKPLICHVMLWQDINYNTAYAEVNKRDVLAYNKERKTRQKPHRDNEQIRELGTKELNIKREQ
jgi:hypothetical protein